MPRPRKDAKLHEMLCSLSRAARAAFLLKYAKAFAANRPRIRGGNRREK